MKKFEYKTLKIENEKLLEVLNREGQSGWEACFDYNTYYSIGTLIGDGSFKASHEICFKREIESQEEKETIERVKEALRDFNTTRDNIISDFNKSIKQINDKYFPETN